MSKINRKGMLGIANIGSLMVALIVMVIALSALSVYVVPVAADIGTLSHNTNVTLTPSTANCEDIGNKYTVTVCNDGPDNIREVRIYRDVDGDGYADPGIIEFECGPVPNANWTLDNRTELYHYCQYETQIIGNNMIEPGECLNFTFSATLANITQECGNKFKISTIDDKIPEGEVRFKFPFVQVDCSDPDVTKTVGEPKLPGQGFDWWITRNTLIEVEVTEEGKCDLGLDYCEINYTVDGGQIITEKFIKFEPITTDWLYNWTFGEDSVHDITILCYDVAGNFKTILETDKVDSTPPETNKTFIGPQKINGLVEWIDGITTIDLTTLDGGPICAIGTDKTWYRNDWWVEGEGAAGCYYPEKYCNFEWYGMIQSPYETAEPGCIDRCQEDMCSGYTGQDWYDCVEECVHVMCRVDPAWKLYDGTPIQKEEESCHVLSFFSVDHLGNTEDMNINCFFVDKTPPLVEKTIHEPVIDVPWELGSSGTGTALVSSQEAYEGDDSVHLLAPLITKYPPSNEARIRIPVDMTLGEISTISWMAMVIDGYIPHVDIIIDTDGDGVKDDALVVEYDKVQPPSDQLLANMNYQTGVWVDTFDDKGIVDDTAGMWLNSGAPGPIGGAGFIYGKLAEWKAGNVDAKVDANTKVIALEIEVDGWIATSEAFVDLVKLNGVGMLALHWVTSDSDIEFTCDDSWKGTAPHPSEDEELCFKVSYDKDTDGYNTDEYCMRYSGAMEGDWCCVSATPKNPFTFNFNENEDSVHDLEYYCRDAVEKASPVYIQYYKVDNNPPIIEKTLNGPQVGDCPPSPESQDLCWIKDWTCGQGNGTDIIINAYDNETLGCAVDEVRCHWWYYLDGSPVKLPVEGYYTSFPIRFYQDTVHELHVECCDGLGNCKEEVETFLVDSSGPNVTKEIIGPKKIDGLVEWIDSVTTINITAVDNPGEPCAVGEDKIYYIDSIKYGPGEMACYDPEQYCGPQQYIDPVVNAYTGPISDLNESCHVLEYWAVDKLGNEGPHEYNCFFVDKTPPNITKDNGLAIPGEGEPMFITPENPYGAFHWVSQNMPITFNCQDVGPHPSGGEKLCVRVSYDYPSWNYITEQYCPHNLTDDGYCCLDMMNDGKGDTTIPPKTFSISFQEDSMHNLEYYCEDAVGKRSEMHTQYYKVDTEPPNVTKVISPPFYGDCPPEPESSDMCYVDTATAIDLNIVDRGEICAVDLVECQWRYQVCGIITGNNSAGMGCTEWSAWNTTMPIKFPEESYHYLEIECWDALGNTWSETELFVVDKTPPKIWKEYGEPHYPAELDSMQYPHWISSSTPITIYADDTDQPHPSGLKELSYRVGIVNDENCMNYTRCQEEEIQANPIVIQSGDSITIPQDSCHLIMITAVDNVGKVSRHKQCVFVDNKSPVPNKTVGEPKTPWDGKDARFYDLDQFCLEPGKCWRTTILTPINLECIDDQPHPVNHETVCFKVELDAEDATETYCDEEHYNGSYNASGDGFCCLEKELDEPFHFGEVSEHNLAYYCVDALGNKGPIDDEKFKVEETKFEIELNRKWNFISVPVRLLDDSMDEVFKDVADTVETVWTYDGEKDEWYVYSPDGNSANDNLDTMLPGWGYWILSSDDDLLVIGGSLMSPAVLPPSKAIAEGWNLIGYYGAEGLEGYYGPVGNGVEAYCALNTIGVSMWDKGFTSLWTYWEPDNPDMWKPYGKYDNMDPGAGYWILAQQDGLYAPSTTCNSLL